MKAHTLYDFGTSDFAVVYKRFTKRRIKFQNRGIENISVKHKVYGVTCDKVKRQKGLLGF